MSLLCVPLSRSTAWRAGNKHPEKPILNPRHALSTQVATSTPPSSFSRPTRLSVYCVFAPHVGSRYGRTSQNKQQSANYCFSLTEWDLNARTDTNTCGKQLTLGFCIETHAHSLTHIHTHTHTQKQTQ